MGLVEVVCAFDVDPEGRATAVAAPDDPLKETGYRWLHFNVGATGLRDWLEAALSPIAAETLLQAETRPRCDVIEKSVALNLRGVNLNPDARAEDTVSLRIWVGARIIVTTGVRRIMTVEALQREAEEGALPSSKAGLLVAFANGLTDRMERISLEMEEQTDALEEAEIDGMLVSANKIAQLRRAVIMFRRFAGPQREALNRFAALDPSLVDAETRLAALETANRASRNAEALEALRERLAILQDHLDAKTAEGMGRNSYILGIAAAVFLPLGFLTGLFGVNVGGMPGVEDPGAFWLLTGGMMVIGLALMAVLRLMRWF